MSAQHLSNHKRYLYSKAGPYKGPTVAAAPLLHAGRELHWLTGVGNGREYDVKSYTAGCTKS